MQELYFRTEKLIGSEAVEKIKNSRVLVLGLGGVGGYVCEALARAGVGTLGLCDMDRIDPTNLNRQILALESSVGHLKADLAEERVKNINSNAVTLKFPVRISEENLADLEIEEWDYVADCIDDVAAKVAVIKTAKEKGVNIISSMGTGNKTDPSRFKVADIRKTDTDKLAKVMRKRLKDIGIDRGVNVLFSDETANVPVVDGVIPSISYMPAIAGLMIAGKIIMDLAGNNAEK